MKRKDAISATGAFLLLLPTPKNASASGWDAATNSPSGIPAASNCVESWGTTLLLCQTAQFILSTFDKSMLTSCTNAAFMGRESPLAFRPLDGVLMKPCCPPTEDMTPLQKHSITTTTGWTRLVEVRFPLIRFKLVHFWQEWLVASTPR